MEELKKLEEEREHNIKGKGKLAFARGVASDEMCTFLIINISSLQLIPVNVIAYRSQYGSANPTGIIGVSIAVTMFSTMVAVVFCKVMQRCRIRKYVYVKCKKCSMKPAKSEGYFLINSSRK